MVDLHMGRRLPVLLLLLGNLQQSASSQLAWYRTISNSNTANTKKYVKAVLPGVKFTGMSCGTKPKSMSRAKQWTDEVENLYRFQQAGYRDEMEYRQIKQLEIDWWPETGFVKKLQRRDNTYYYYNRKRECEDKEVHKVKMYAY